MEHDKISKLLNDSVVSKFLTKKIDQSKRFIKRSILQYQKIGLNWMLRSDLCDYSDACIVVKGRISVTGTENANRRNKKQTFKNIISFRSCISKINNTLIDNAEELDFVMPI